MLRVTYLGHARRRMAQRGVQEKDVEITLAHPDVVEVTPKNSHRYMRTMFDGRTLKVWVTLPEVGDHRQVRSVAWKGEDDE